MNADNSVIYPDLPDLAPAEGELPVVVPRVEPVGVPGPPLPNGAQRMFLRTGGLACRTR